MEPVADTDPRKYKAGAAEAKRRAIELYQQYLSAQKNPKPEVAKRLKNLQENPKGSNESRSARTTRTRFQLQF